MCGVVAIYSYNINSPLIDREEIRRIRDYMISRGPDGKGEWFSSDGRVGLAHRRLSIIDLSDKAAQPMANKDNSLVISFNGEIYNYKELRKGLEGKGYFFQSKSDTEVLLHLYAEKGEKMFHELRGMYAFALWDAKKRAMLLVRDPYGIKPLYYSDNGHSVRIASQVKALLAGGKVSKAREPAGVVGFFLLGNVPEPFTMYQAIQAVPTGSFVWITSAGVSESVRYFSIASIFQKAVNKHVTLSSSEQQEEVRDALLDSVRHHLVADVPVGAFLSAGIDSGALVGLSRDAGIEHIRTVTLTFEEFRGKHEDEAPLAEQIAKQFGTLHTTQVITYQDFKNELHNIIEAMDQPSIDGINTYFVSRAAARLGLKVALSGLGGDELFGGYPAFRDIPRWVRILGIPSHIPYLGEIFRKMFLMLPQFYIARNAKIAGLVKYGGSYAGAYLLRRGMFMPWELPDLLDIELVQEGLHRLKPLKHIAFEISHPDPGTGFSRVATLEAALYMRNQLLRDTDWASMAHSLEVRTPLVDAALLETLAPVLVADKKVNKKAMLAESPARALDYSVIKRVKTGFGVPMQKWLQTTDGLLDAWRNVPLLAQPGCHWARRFAYSLFSNL